MPTPSATASSSRIMTPSVEVRDCFSTIACCCDVVFAALLGKSCSSATDSSRLSIFASSLSQSLSAMAPLTRATSLRSRVFSRQTITFDLLVEIRPRHIEQPRRLRDVPVRLPKLRQEEGAFRRVLEFLERPAFHQRAEARLLRRAL